MVGSKAGSNWRSDDLMQRAGTTDKRMHVVEVANHMSMYDGEAYINEAVDQLGPFFKSKL
ncbi:MAG: hypothetical protein R2712_09310 [Vicinamibacterales bacterium]